jgi:hypothetical protein
MPMRPSTPSLGIDHVRFKETKNSVTMIIGFQLPLSGSLELRPDREADRLPPPLSTPSLGITEPDSGIFRLSAAFCRGTSLHK